MGEATSPDSRPISVQDALPGWCKLKVESWDDLRDLGSNNVGSMIELLKPNERTNYGDTESDKVRKQAVVVAIKEHTQGAEEKPYIPSLRPEDYFKIDQRVMVFTPTPTPESKYDFIAGSPDFVPGRVELTTDAGHVQVHTDAPYYKGSRGQEVDVASGAYSSPSFIPQEEFDYLTTHPDYLSIWLNNLDDSGQRDIQALKAALKAKAEAASAVNKAAS